MKRKNPESVLFLHQVVGLLFMSDTLREKQSEKGQTVVACGAAGFVTGDLGENRDTVRLQTVVCSPSATQAKLSESNPPLS